MKLTKRQQEVLMMMPREWNFTAYSVWHGSNSNSLAGLNGIERVFSALRQKGLIATNDYGESTLTESGQSVVRRLKEGP